MEDSGIHGRQAVSVVFSSYHQPNQFGSLAGTYTTSQWAAPVRPRTLLLPTQLSDFRQSLTERQELLKGSPTRRTQSPVTLLP